MVWRPEPSAEDLAVRIAEAGLEQGSLLEMYRTMCLIRVFEEAIRDRYWAGKTPDFNIAAGPIRGLIHLAVGQEAVAVGACTPLREADVVVSTHRAHHHALAKGVDPTRLAAEIFGKVTGLSRGKGGELHLFDRNRRFLTSGVVGTSFAQATGAAFGFQYRGERNVVVMFTGEGAANHGAFAEALNTASLWQLPLVVVIEDNLYAGSVPKWGTQAVNQHYQRAQSHNIPAYLVDGMDVIDVYEATESAIGRARDGYGPTVVEAVCYRYRGHFEGDPGGYRSRQEEETWERLDPIPRLGRRLEQLGWAGDETRTAVRRMAAEEAIQAVKVAEKSPLPNPAEALQGVFA
ncbi:thiamine pyrophosphate-dependent dehydrogenase E1 component subunit alpha [Planosporangium flavigriseum]|uniref:Pyruvate dehydrogenase E1 component subunit alpha n=1 Tax=Planosporangium flavigriseum TaxID=373681 RepID=A0A8J3LMM9_9ACTN|nr:thiamine pyrophosphate-dependent dehydrogenase E1 component subunit alpha [Planosporangium flavigriseum]NJC67498.1 thiamine pyrophosphate-dependent dehydrogenase E1 component subunit alpha [Planosporangium flavigriseum]GIG75552.1 pyruvate dehydrogenase E1 component subunit alpha [Planosporangium flavigriseum]